MDNYNSVTVGTADGAEEYLDTLIAGHESLREDTAINSEKHIFIAIDGRCGAGKSTLGKRLAKKYNATLFHMDDFFLRSEQRTPERLAQPGGNVDYERFTEEIIKPIAEGREVLLRCFDHTTFQPGEAKKINVNRVVIVEGTYSCHILLRDYFDARIFVTTDYDTQLARILERSGSQKYEMFKSKWIPLEELYFDGMKVAECCDYVVRT